MHVYHIRTTDQFSGLVQVAAQQSNNHLVAARSRATLVFACLALGQIRRGVKLDGATFEDHKWNVLHGCA